MYDAIQGPVLIEVRGQTIKKKAGRTSKDKLVEENKWQKVIGW